MNSAGASITQGLGTISMAHYKLRIIRFTQAKESTNVHSSSILISESMDQASFSVFGALPLSMHKHIRQSHPCQKDFDH